MDYQDLKQAIASYSGRDLTQRKNWYSAAAVAYNQARPRYPQALIQQVIAIAQLSSASSILEVGCGPGTATIPFAQLGCSIVCLEPNLAFYRLAQENCNAYPKVDLQNTSFEEWTVEIGKFNAVLAANSFHWISPEISYSKAAQALQGKGYLVLLWNKELQPSYPIYQRLAEIYQAHVPSFAYQYQDAATQGKILRGLGQMVTDSGQFKTVISDHMVLQVTYPVDQYLTLLNTYSPYLNLDEQTREDLFTGLRDCIDQNFDGVLHLSYISAFHIAQKD
jgi:SAM-dependent methyltransferase